MSSWRPWRVRLSNNGDSSLTDEDFCASDVRFHRTLVEAAGETRRSTLRRPGVIESLQPAVNMVIFRFSATLARSQLSMSACIGDSRRETAMRACCCAD